jgi:hypothetical protein
MGIEEVVVFAGSRSFVGLIQLLLPLLLAVEADGEARGNNPGLRYLLVAPSTVDDPFAG